MKGLAAILAGIAQRIDPFGKASLGLELHDAFAVSVALDQATGSGEIPIHFPEPTLKFAVPGKANTYVSLWTTQQVWDWLEGKR